LSGKKKKAAQRTAIFCLLMKDWSRHKNADHDSNADDRAPELLIAELKRSSASVFNQQSTISNYFCGGEKTSCGR